MMILTGNLLLNGDNIVWPFTQPKNNIQTKTSMGRYNIEKLMELKQLYEQGILTKEEMEAEKAKILNASTPKDESPNNEIPPVEDADSSFASTSDEENHGRNKVIIGIAAAIVVAIVAIIGFFLNKQTEPKEAVTDDIELAQLAGDDMNETITDTEGIDSSTSATINAKNKVEDLLKNCNWIKHDDGFQYPASFKHHQVFLDEIPADVEVYTYDSIELCYWPLLGVWSVTDEFPSQGLYLSPTETVKNITYRAESKGIASGYTNSGKIYYLKQKIMHGEGVDHSKFLVLINPPEYNKAVEKITNMIATW